MAVGFARPDVADLAFHLFDRSVHPELFASHAERRLLLDEFDVTIRIGDAGHLLQMCSGGRTFSEVATTHNQPLPFHKRFFEKRMRGSHEKSVQLDGGIGYHVSFQVEQLEPETFLNYQQELRVDSNKAEVCYEFPSANRIVPGALSYVTVDAWSRNLLVHAFHTFPDNCAVVKTQSLFEV